MKKKYLLFIILGILMFITTNKVYAASCDTYGCAKCIYNVSNYELTYDISSNGTNASLDFSSKKTNDSNIIYNFTNNIDKEAFVSGNKIVCPSNIYAVYGMNGTSFTARLYDTEKENSVKVVLSSSSTNNNKTISGENSIVEEDDNEEESSSNSTSITGGYGCSILSNDLVDYLQLILDYIRIAAIVLTVVLTIMDYIKATFSSDDKGNAKANKRFTSRLIILALLFLIPTVLSFVLALFNIQGSGDSGTCGIY